MEQPAPRSRGCQGTIRVELVTNGTAAHSARAWMSVNAIHALAPALDTLAAYVSEEIEVEGLVYREGLNAVAVSEVATNMIPPSAVLTVSYRYAPDKSTDEALARIEAWFGYGLHVTDEFPGRAAGPEQATRARVRHGCRG